MLSREVVFLHQRQRAVDALAECAAKRGVSAVTVGDVCRRAKMSRKTFYDLFGGIEGCRRYAFLNSFEHLFERVEAPPSEGHWLSGVRDAIGQFYEAVREQPGAAELCLLHSLGATREADEGGFEAAIAAMSSVLAGGRAAGRAACGSAYHDPPPPAEDFLARATVSLTAKRVRQHEVDELIRDRDDMVRLIANQFFGVEEAERQWRFC